jgi:hypothetical protein
MYKYKLTIIMTYNNVLLNTKCEKQINYNIEYNTKLISPIEFAYKIYNQDTNNEHKFIHFICSLFGIFDKQQLNKIKDKFRNDKVVSIFLVSISKSSIVSLLKILGQYKILEDTVLYFDTMALLYNTKKDYESYLLFKRKCINENCLIVKQSNIYNAGNGLFTKVNIKKGEEILIYDGYIETYIEHIRQISLQNNILNKLVGVKVMDNDAILLPFDNSLAIYCNDTVIIENNMLFVNRHNIPHRSLIYKTNVKFHRISQNIVGIVAIMDIKKGSELYLNYGNSYWLSTFENNIMYI